MPLRHYVKRILLGGTAIHPAAGVRTQNALEGAVTGVAELALIDEGITLAAGATLSIDHVAVGTAWSGGYASRPQFGGSLDEIDATSYPHAVTLRATGPLAGLRRVRTKADGDLDLTGLTDAQAAVQILTFCGVPFDASDILGLGYVLGQVQAVKWQVGRSGADLLNELDTVFGCATVEIPEGRVVRFPYAPCPSFYSNPVYAGTYRRGDATVAIYDHQRTIGQRDQIRNYWQVTGLSYQDADGCNYQVTAEGKAPNALLMVGTTQTYSGPDLVQSDLIQTEDIAKAIAIRQLQQQNRLPDTIRLVAPLDVRVQPGKLILVKDPAYGIGLSSETAYLVTNVDFDGDLMTIDAVGGAPGDTGTVTSSINRCCGTQQSDGTCTDVGTNPAALAPPALQIPPDPSLGFLDPGSLDLGSVAGLDPGSLGGVPDLTPPADPTAATPNPKQLLAQCTKLDTGFGEPVLLGSTGPWRTSAYWLVQSKASDPTIQLDTLLAMAPQQTLVYNTTPDGTAKATSNDYQFGKNENVTISGCAQFNWPNSYLQVGLMAYSGTTPTAWVMFFSEPGDHVAATSFPGGSTAGGDFGIVCQTEDSNAGYPDVAPGSNTGGGDFTTLQDNGGMRGSPIPVGTQFRWSVSFDVSEEYQQIDATASGAGGASMQDAKTFYPLYPKLEAPSPIHYDDCDHPFHILTLTFGHNGDAIPPEGQPGGPTIDKPFALFCGISLSGQCQVNPDYTPDPGATAGAGVVPSDGSATGGATGGGNDHWMGPIPS